MEKQGSAALENSITDHICRKIFRFFYIASGLFGKTGIYCKNKDDSLDPRRAANRRIRQIPRQFVLFYFLKNSKEKQRNGRGNLKGCLQNV
jgi:hypothetical protein